MVDVRICLLGPLEIYGGEHRLPNFPTQKSKNLFAYLALNHDRLWEREALASLFWADSPAPSARKCLRTELWRIRSVFCQTPVEGGDLLVIDKGRVGFCKRPSVWLDVDEFTQRFEPLENRAGDSLGTGECQVLTDCIELYRGDFLEGNYEDWAVSARDRFQGQFINILIKLLEFHRARGQWSTAITYAREALRQDTFLEHVHRDLMVCLWQSGRRAAALQQHVQYAELLERELGVEPMLETIELYEQIKVAGGSQLPSFSSSVQDLDPQGAGFGVDRLLSHLTALQNHLGEVDKALREMVERVKEISLQPIE